MTKFIFSLQNFLNIKEKLENQKKTEYANAISNLQKEKLVLNNIFASKENIIYSMKESINNSINPNLVQDFNNYLKFLDNEVIRQDKVIKEHQKNVDEARLNLIEAMKQRKIITSLKDKKKEEFFKEEFIKEQKTIDELVSFKYNNQS